MPSFRIQINQDRILMAIAIFGGGVASPTPDALLSRQRKASLGRIFDPQLAE